MANIGLEDKYATGYLLFCTRALNESQLPALQGNEPLLQHDTTLGPL